TSPAPTERLAPLTACTSSLPVRKIWWTSRNSSSGGAPAVPVGLSWGSADRAGVGSSDTVTVLLCDVARLRDRGDGPDQLLGVRVLRAVEDVPDITEFHHLAVVHGRDAVGELGGDGQ